MKKAIVGLFILALLTPASADDRKFIEVDVDGRVELETAWVVSPHVVITVPRSEDGLFSTRDGMYEGIRMWYFGASPRDGVKSYISYRELEVSKDIPPEVLKTYEHLLPVIEEMGGIMRIIEEETDMRVAQV